MLDKSIVYGLVPDYALSFDHIYDEWVVYSRHGELIERFTSGIKLDEEMNWQEVPLTVELLAEIGYELV